MNHQKKRKIHHVGIIGSGVMGSQIALLMAGSGLRVTLLDIPTPENSSLNVQDKNAWVRHHLQQTTKLNPSPVYSKSNLKHIRTGNIEENLEWMSEVDWIIEVIVEKLEIKRDLFEKIDAIRKEDTIISSNTSGIPIALMAEGRSESFKRHFLGTHFFNPPRYIRLLEIIPTSFTDSALVDFLMEFGEKFLGKQTVLAKDTPAFIGNRIGVFSISNILKYTAENDITIDEVDKLTGPIIGRPKSATFRTADVVGIDTYALVANSLADNAVTDEFREEFRTPPFIAKMIENKWLGSKTGKGFYQKVKTENGSEIRSLNLSTLEYEPAKKVKFEVIDQVKTLTNWSDKLTVLINDNSKAGDFYRKTFFPLWNYAANKIPEIADHFYQIDDAIEAGFGWEIGPFKLWEFFGIENGVKGIESLGLQAPSWILDMLNAGHSTFYKTENGQKYYYDIPTQSYKVIPGSEAFLLIETIPEEQVVWKNSGAKIRDIGDGVLHLEFFTKMNTIGTEVLQGVNTAIDIAEQEGKGLVISNDGQNFSAGANVGLIFMMAAEQEYDELNWAIQYFQNTMMRIRYSSIPVVVAPHNMALGGGCEMCLHADKVVAHSELYMGLVEFGVGVIPGGGGTKEMAVRLSEELKQDDVRLNRFRERFLTIGQAKVSTSAQEAFELGYLRKGIDIIVPSRKRLLQEAKLECIRLLERGYTRPIEKEDVLVLGQEVLGLAFLGANSMKVGNYISDHDQFISEKLAYVLAGGDVTQPTEVTEKYLLNLERKAFLELCMQHKTLERLQSIVVSGKVLRN